MLADIQVKIRAPVCLTSGTPSSLAATKLLSFRPAYLRKCEENSDSIDCAGCTETITSLDKYAIRATIRKIVSVSDTEEAEVGRGGAYPAQEGSGKSASTYQPLQASEFSMKLSPCLQCDEYPSGQNGERKRDGEMKGLAQDGGRGTPYFSSRLGESP